MSGADLEAQVDALEEEGRYEDAIAVLKQLAEKSGDDLRWHIAWMHTRAGNREDAAKIWKALRAERPDDPGVAYLHAAALIEDGHHADALSLLSEALETGLRVSSDETMLRKVADERLEALGRAGVPPAEVDHRAREVLARHAPATPWFTASGFDAARELWGTTFTAGAADHANYTAGLDRTLRHSGGGVTGRNPVLVAVSVAEVERFAEEHSWRPEWPVTYDQVAAAALRDDPQRGTTWPPGRNEPCWCGSRVKYKRCCGR